MIEKMLELYKKYKEIILYLFFGVLTTIVSLGSKSILLFVLLDASNPFELQLSIVISWILAVLFAYITNRIFVFNSKNQNKIKEFISFIMGRIFTLFLEMLIMWFVTFLKLNTDLYVIIFTLLTQVIVVIANYILSKLFVFKK